MSVAQHVGPPVTRVPPAGWWVVLGVVIGAQVLLGWVAALGILALFLVQRARPLDFIVSYLFVQAGASFVDYTTGQLTAQLTVLTIGILFLLYCYALSRRGELLQVAHTPLTAPILVFLTLTLANFVRGIVIGNSARYAGLELLPVLALTSSLLIANHSMTQARIRTAIAWLWVTGLGQAALGFYAFAIFHRRVGGIFFTPVCGVIAALFLNFALRESNYFKRTMWLLAMMPLLMHQFLSFTRGFWLAWIGSTLFSVTVYGGFRNGARERWKRSAATFLSLAGLGIAAAAVMAMLYGVSGLAATAAARLSSSTSTEMTYAAASNIARLVEYAVVIQDIIQAPWFGHGLGFYFVVRNPIDVTLYEQWYTHQNYLLVWLKQGLLGLAIFVWVLIAAVKMGLRGRDLPESWRAAWCTGAAAVAVHIIIYCNVHFPMSEVNTVFTVSLIWGVAMSMVADGHTVLHFRRRSAVPKTAIVGRDFTLEPGIR